jgi:hypothetical protein
MNDSHRLRVTETESVDAPWSRRAVRRFLIVFAIAATVLLLPWPRWGRVFSAAFSGYGNFVVGFFAIGGTDGPTFFSPSAADRRRADVGEWSVLLAPRASDVAQAAPLDTRILGYTPFAIFAALVLATAVPRRRRLKVAAGGAALLLARLAIAIALPVGRSLGPTGPSWAVGPVTDVLWFAFIMPPVMSYVSAALAWWIPLALTTRARASSSSSPARRGVKRQRRRV